MEFRFVSRVSMRFLIVLIVLFACFGASISAGESRQSKNVQVSLRANWPGTPLLLEAGELLSREWKDLYWDFIDLWLQQDGASSPTTARACFQKIVENGRSLLNEQLGTIFEFSLALRSTSPKLVLYRQLAQDSLYSLDTEDEVDMQYVGVNASEIDSHSSSSIPAVNCCWIDTGSKVLSSVSDFLKWLDGLDDSSSSLVEPELFEFDHVYIGSSAMCPTSILYGALGTECFREFHLVLIEAAKKGKVKYVVRPVLSSGCEAMTSYCGSVGSPDALNLGGYGVELALKNMEYKAMDDSAVNKGVTLEDPNTEDLSQDVRGFIFSKLLERKPELNSDIMFFRDHLLSLTVSDALEVWELKDLGHQTAQRIIHASDPLQAMQEINQNFPSIVSLLSRTKLNDSIKDEIVANQRMVPPGKSLLAFNGALMNIEDIDLYHLMDLVHEELSLTDQFLKVKLPPSAIYKLLSAPPTSESTSVRVDFRSANVHYLNNLEEDAMYKRWRKNINEILSPVFPGQMRYIGKNLYHAVYVLDPGTFCGAMSIDAIVSMYENNVPMRFGVILYSTKAIGDIEENGGELPVSSHNEDMNENKEDLSGLVIRLFTYIKEDFGAQLAFQFLSNMNRLWGISEDLPEETLEVYHVEEAFVETLMSKVKSPPQDMLLKIEKDLTYKDVAVKSSLSVFKLGLSSLKCCLLMNGLVFESSEDAAMNAMNEELPRLQELVYYGQVTSSTDILEHFLSENGYPRYNPLIIGDGKGKKKFVSLSASIIGDESLLGDVSYLHSRGTADEVKPVTHLLVVNIATRKGLQLLHEGIHYLMTGSKRAQIGVLFNFNGSAAFHALLFAEVFEISASSFSNRGTVLNFLDQFCSFYRSSYLTPSTLEGESYKLLEDRVYELAEANNLPSESYRKALSMFSANPRNSHLNKVSRFLHAQGLDLETTAVIANGRVIVSSDTNVFSSEDFVLLESVEYEQRAKSVMQIIDEVQWVDIDPDDLTSKFISDVVLLVSSSLSVRERSSERARFEILNAKYSAVILENENSTIHIDAVIDPLSSSGQKLAPLLHILWRRIKPSMRIVLNPMSSLVDIPLKNYYRYVVPSVDDFGATDFSINGPKALFLNMPLSKTLTMSLDVPEPWLVEPTFAIHDLDNILLEKLGGERTLKAGFDLESLILTGHCSEKDHDPPRGLQLILGTKSTPHLVDTLVMANLGYWQMKVSPGVWYLQLAPGRSTELYEFKEVDDGSLKDSKRIVTSDLRGKTVHLDVLKRKGREHDELLVASEENDRLDTKDNDKGWNTNFLKWASDFISGDGKSRKSRAISKDDKAGARHGKTINIFSIASGHLYERFLKIMILSVLKNTERPVKFWFIKNYLSPQFKDVIPFMAQEYGFMYELITYKWPSWLHKQKEKQRIIWAYKILFLDVIFPLSLEKVIFVDADQVVRTDMGELYDMDIKGKPLAYTPFCDNNKEMDGYRFWRQGFWKDHLRGKPYHISALFVVDLVKFRQTAAGDNLRVFYETLSKDPNSLSNLDQDLPNYAQHTVPIFSLPQEWLWCESWCGNATKSKAKTIDLCNNPMTKEPKLQGAKRIVSEWVDLDAEARQVTAKILGEGVESQDAIQSPSRKENLPQSDDVKVDGEHHDEL